MGCKLSKVYKIEILLENELRVYQPSDKISGQVLIQVDEDTIIHTCTIECFGLAKTKLPNGKDSLNNSALGYFSSFNLNENDRIFPSVDVSGERITDMEYRKFAINKSTSLLANIIDPEDDTINEDDDSNRKMKPDHFSLLNHLQYACLRNPQMYNVDDSQKHIKSDSIGETSSTSYSAQSFVYYHEKTNLLKNYCSKSALTTNTLNNGVPPRSYRSNEGGIFSNLPSSNSQSSSYLAGSLVDSPKRKSHPEFLISRGIHLFNFEIDLPSNLPSSFSLPKEYSSNEIIARLRYGLKVTVSNTDANVTHTKEIDFIVYRPLDLRTIPRLKDRVTIHKEFMIPGCWGFSNRTGGSIKCDFSLNKTGFVPGETILPEIFLKNSSAKNIETITLRFLQIILMIGKNNDHHVEVLRLFSTRLTSRNRTNVSSFEHIQVHLKPKILPQYNCLTTNKSSNNTDKGLRRNQRRNNQECALPGFGSTAQFVDKIHIPPVPCSGLEGIQSIIHIEYAIVLKMRLQGDKKSSNDLRINIPVTIGSEPTRETSFNESESVIPCYGRFNYKTGEVVEFKGVKKSLEEADQIDAYHAMEPVYRYYKPNVFDKHEASAKPTKSSRSHRSGGRLNSESSRKRILSSTRTQTLSDPEESEGCNVDPFLPRSLSTLDIENEKKKFPNDESDDSYRNSHPDDSYENDSNSLVSSSRSHSSSRLSDSYSSDEASSSNENSSTSMSDSVIQDGLVVDKRIQQNLIKKIHLKTLNRQDSIGSTPPSLTRTQQKRSTNNSRQTQHPVMTTPSTVVVTSSVSQRSSTNKTKKSSSSRISSINKSIDVNRNELASI